MIEKKTKCSEMALPVSFNLLIVEQHNTITKTVYNVFAKCLALFANSLVLSIQPEISSERQWFEAAERPILMIAPRSFSTFAHKTSKKLWRRNGVLRFQFWKTVLFVDVVFVLFYASQWCFEAWQWFFVIVDCQVVKHRRKDGLKLIKYFRHL